MTATRKSATAAAGQPTHLHHRGCPGKGAAFTDKQAEDAYRHHRERFEADLEAQLAARTRRDALRRPDWWWRFAPDAALYRADPGRYERPDDYTVNPSAVPELWMREGIMRRRIEQLGRVRFLVTEGHAQGWEVEHAIARGGSSHAGPYFVQEARVAREALAARKTAT
jgi:hypothetical protein